MAAFVAITVFYLVLLQTPTNIFAVKDEEEWKSATATYSKETDGSIVTEGACGYGDLHKISYGKYSAGLSSMLFNRGSTCGACYELRCVDHILWCLQGSPTVILTATDFCPPNYGFSSDYGGWCNFPKEHFEMSEAAFAEIAEKKADIVPVQYRRVRCDRSGGMRFTVSGNSRFFQVLITNVGMDGELVAVKVKGSRTGWIPLARNWGQNWQSNVNLHGQPLSFEVTSSSGRALTSYSVAPGNLHHSLAFPLIFLSPAHDRVAEVCCKMITSSLHKLARLLSRGGKFLDPSSLRNRSKSIQLIQHS